MLEEQEDQSAKQQVSSSAEVASPLLLPQQRTEANFDIPIWGPQLQLIQVLKPGAYSRGQHNLTTNN
jgi:hypothetical protein